MIVKYKVSDFAKDLNLSAKKVLDELAAMGSTGKKNSSNLEENELNYLLFITHIWELLYIRIFPPLNLIVVYGILKFSLNFNLPSVV